MKLLSFGEIIWDVYPDCKTLGGAPLNFTAVSSLLGAVAYLWSAVGNDDLGTTAVIKAESYGINTKYVSTVKDKDTGRCNVSLSDKGIPVYKIAKYSAYDYIGKHSFEKDFDVLYFGTLALRYDYNITVLKSVMRDVGFKEIFCDINIRKPFVSKTAVRFGFANATILKISQEEFADAVSCVLDECDFSENTVIKIAEKFQNLKLLILTKGENGSVCYDCISKEFYCCDAVQTEVVSTVGAGDSFGAAFLSKYFEGADASRCLEFASRVSAYVCSIKEAIPDNLNFK